MQCSVQDGALDPRRLHRLLGDRSVHPRMTRVRYIHRAITAWLTHVAAIRDAARQALVVNCDRHFDDIAWEEDRYLPHRRSGQSTCNITAPLGEVNPRLRPTLLCLAETNTDLDQILDELNVMGKAYLQLAVRTLH